MADTLRCILVPADPGLPITEHVLQLVPIGSDTNRSVLRFLNELVHGDVEVVHTGPLHELNEMNERHMVVMLVNEDGQREGFATNSRAWAFYPNPFIAIVGDAVLIGQDRTDPVDGYSLESLYPHLTPKSVAQKITEILG